MHKILIVDDDDAMRALVKRRLSDTYEVIDTGNPEQALGLALEHKPAAILLDLMMPDCSGFELCQSLHALSYTARIPIFVVSGESAAKYRDYVSTLGASGFFEKPLNFPELKSRLAQALQTSTGERRAHVRVRMRFGGFLCSFPVALASGAVVEVFLANAGQERFVGRARSVRTEEPDSPLQRCGFQFLERTSEWILQH